MRKFDGKEKLRQIVKVTRDARGLETELSFQDAKGRVTDRMLPQWNDRGFMTGSVMESAKDKSSMIETIELVKEDAAGNWIEVRKRVKFVARDGEFSSDPETVVREIEYHP